MNTIDVSLAYTRLAFFADDEIDNELSISLSKGFGENLSLELSGVYSTEAEGTFFELSGSYEREVIDRWTLGTTLLLGVNQGFIPDEHDGFNNIQFSIESNYGISDSLALLGYVAYTIGLEERSGETLEDLFFGGVSLVYSF